MEPKTSPNWNPKNHLNHPPPWSMTLGSSRSSSGVYSPKYFLLAVTEIWKTHHHDGHDESILPLSWSVKPCNHFRGAGVVRAVEIVGQTCLNSLDVPIELHVELDPNLNLKLNYRTTYVLFASSILPDCLEVPGFHSYLTFPCNFLGGSLNVESYCFLVNSIVLWIWYRKSCNENDQLCVPAEFF